MLRDWALQKDPRLHAADRQKIMCGLGAPKLEYYPIEARRLLMLEVLSGVLVHSLH